MKTSSAVMLIPLGGVLLLSGCLQRGVPEKEAPAHSVAPPSVEGLSEGLSDAGRVAPCPESLSRSWYLALMRDGGAPQQALGARGPDGGLGIHGGSAPRMGSLSKETIRETIRMNRGSVLACYNGVLRLQPHGSFGGKLAVTFVISKTGDVCAAEVSESTVKDSRLGRCVLDAVASWHFPPPEGGGQVIVTYPFIFRPAIPKDGGGQEHADAGPEEASL